MKSFRSSSLFHSLGILLLAAPGLGAEPDPTGNPPLDQPTLVAEIVAQNPELKFYEAEIAAAESGRHTAGRLADPEVALTLGRKRVRAAGGAPTESGTAWSVSVMQPFEWPGRLDLRKALADQDLVLARLGLDRFRHALGSRARSLAFGLHAAQLRAAAIREVADRFSDLRTTFLAREPAGITPLLETRVIEAAELSLQRRATEAELALSGALLELNQLRGTVPDAPLRVATASLRFRDAPDRTALLAAAREGNFTYRIRQAELERQGLSAQLARKERTPAASVGPFVSQESAGDRETMVGLGLSLSLPVSGRSRSAAEVAEIRQRQAGVAALLAQREMEREVILAAESYALKVAEIRRWSPGSVTKFREAAALADRHYRLGAVPVATYVELQQGYLDAVNALLDTEREALEAALRLQELAGVTLNLAEATP